MERELNEIEYLNWCFEQPYNMVVTVQLRGELRPEQLRLALDKAQARHPLLRVNTQLDGRGIPRFFSEGIGPIPLAVLDGSTEELVARELAFTFERDSAAARAPLMRVTLVRRGERGADLVLTVQHIVADGFSLVFLVADLLRFIDAPDTPIEVLDAPASDADVLPARARARVSRSAFWFRAAYFAARLLVGRKAPPLAATPEKMSERTWQLTQAQTAALRARCHAERVSVQSAICTAFLPDFPAVHTPVNLRGLLSRPVGQSVGLYVGAANVNLRYRTSRDFWSNARSFHSGLRRKLRDPFLIFEWFSKAVPPKLVREMGPLLVRVMGTERPFSVTNLGVLDALEPKSRALTIEGFSGAVSGPAGASVVTVFTLGGTLRLRLLAAKPELLPLGDAAVQRLREAIDAPAGDRFSVPSREATAHGASPLGRG